MKKIDIIKLNQLIQADLDARRLNALRGGSGDCYCSCSWYCSCSGPLEDILKTMNDEAYTDAWGRGSSDISSWA